MNAEAPMKNEAWALAQINVAKLLKPEGDPQVQEFFDNLDQINALAEQSEGFLWRLKEEEGGNATGLEFSPDPNLIVNMSVWQDADTLFNFVYRSAHTPIMAKRRQWFERAVDSYQALWWVKRDHEPTIEEGLAKIWLIDRFGPTPQAFHFKSRFPAPQSLK